jgi:hypothetical protein
MAALIIAPIWATEVSYEQDAFVGDQEKRVPALPVQQVDFLAEIGGFDLDL